MWKRLPLTKSAENVPVLVDTTASNMSGNEPILPAMPSLRAPQFKYYPKEKFQLLKVCKCCSVRKQNMHSTYLLQESVICGALTCPTSQSCLVRQDLCRNQFEMQCDVFPQMSLKTMVSVYQHALGSQAHKLCNNKHTLDVLSSPALLHP